MLRLLPLDEVEESAEMKDKRFERLCFVSGGASAAPDEA